MYKIFTINSGISDGYIRKTLLIMRLTTVILIVTIMQVSANSFAQKITYAKKNATLEMVFKEIMKQTDYNVLWYAEKLKDAKPIDADFRNTSIETVLEKIMIDQPFSYTIKGKTIVIKSLEYNALRRVYDGFHRVFSDITVAGKIVDERGNGLPGATIKLKGNSTRIAVFASGSGNFSLRIPGNTAILVVSYIGYKTKEVSVSGADVDLIIRMEPISRELAGVTVVSTGYQTLPKERATGSFDKVDNELFNRTTSTDVLSRLNGTVPGIYFNNSNALNQITIRGISSLSDVSPLVVLDNIPYDGDINNINPNDVENITILKDAAAASIWGTRAGSGVIVITTKKGKYENPLQISFNTNYTVSKKPNLFYIPQISSTDFIGVERFLFSNGWYNDKLAQTDPYVPFVTPVVDLLNKQSQLLANDISGRAQIDAQIDALGKYDVRNDYLKYVYRSQNNQQYALNINGGSKQVSYFVSAGYDKNLNNTVTSDYNRINLRSNLDFRPIKDLEIQTGILYTKSQSHNIGSQSIIGYNQGQLSTAYPYARFVDDQGNPANIGTVYDTNYLNNLSTNPKLLDWRYKPLTDLYQSQNIGNSEDVLLNFGTKYAFSTVFSAEVKYQYERANSKNEDIYQAGSYFARDIINSYTSPANYADPITGNDASYIRAIPSGGIYNSGTGINTNQTIRGQFNADKNWNNKHHLVALAGAEIRKAYTISDNEGWRYAYDPELKTFQTVNYLNTQFPLFNGGVNSIPYGSSLDDNDNRFTSYFANASYTYDNRYIISASARKDASNVFGVNSNKRGAPLWSAGAAWNISNESFYKFTLIPYLKFRATYGYSGTTVTGIPAFAVILHGMNPTTLLPTVVSQNLPNPDLRWEKNGMLNIGIDFGAKKNRLTGSIEYFDKRSTDLLALSPIDPTTGYAQQTFNTANLRGSGVDISLNSLNLHYGKFTWNSNLTFSYNKAIVTKYLLKPTSASYYVYAQGINPVEGQDAYSIYAFPSAGLNPLNGNPRGYLNGQISEDYASIFNQNLSAFKNIGSTRPRFYGSLRNTFNYQRFSLSTSFYYKLGYYFRRDGINYSNLFYSNTGNSEFADRWQKPGDENRTTVPSMIYLPDTDRDNFYKYSDELIENGGYIKLQDVTASYTFDKIKGLKNCRLYSNISNLGFIWRANKKGIDPDVAIGGYPNPFTFAIGLNATF